MYPAIRLGDPVVGICSNPSGPFITASITTFVNNMGQVRLGDTSIPGPAITGSTRTFVDSRSAIRLPDQVHCGRIVRGSIDTFIY